MLPMNTVEMKPGKWRNWSGVVESHPQTVAYPKSVEEVVMLVEHCQRENVTLRAVGSGHSFTPLVKTSGVIVSLERLSGLVDIDTTTHTATVWAGTTLRDLGQLLAEKGYAQENLGDIDAQSIAGAIGTGTHGTGHRFGNLSTQVEELTAVLGTGEIITCSNDHDPDLFKALLVSFGTLGIIVKVKLRVLPAYKLAYESKRMSLTECLTQLESLKEDHRHVEFYAFPYSTTVQVKLMDTTEEAPTQRGFVNYFNDIVMENWAFGALSRTCRALPALCRSASRFAAQNVPVTKTVDYSHKRFATPRLVRFNEMEYNIPAQHMGAAVTEILHKIEELQIPVHFPIECRLAKSDDIWLSPAYRRESAYVAVHMFQGMPFESYFRMVGDIMAKYEGRPHWGKMHFLKAQQLAALYPRWNDFQRVRLECDPKGVFLTPYFEELFGTDRDDQELTVEKSDSAAAKE